MKLLYKIPEASECLGVGRTRVYELMQTGDLRYVMVGASRRIPADALTDYVDSLRDNHGPATA